MPSPAARKSAVGPARSTARLFASSCLVASSLLLGVAGCESESEQADRAVYQGMKAGAAAEPGEKRVAELEKVAKTANASPAAGAQAKALLAQAQVEQAQGVLREVHHNELTIARLVGEITSIAGQIQNNNAIIAGFQQLAPKTTSQVAKLLEGQSAQAQGKGAQDVWKFDKAGQLPAASNARARAEKLQPEVKALQDKRAELSKARSDADRKAADLTRQSRRSTGKASLDFAVKAAAETKRASDVATQIARVDDKLMELNQDIALANAQAEMLEQASKSFTERAGATLESQKTLEGLIKQHQELSNAMVHGAGGDGSGGTAPAAPSSDVEKPDAAAPGASSGVESEGTVRLVAFQDPAETPAEAPAEDATPAPAPTPRRAGQPGARPPGAAASGPPSTIVTNATMAAKAKELSGLLADTESKRQAALGLLTSALANYDGAIADAEKYRKVLSENMQNPNLREAPQQEAWKTLADVYSPAKLGLQKANAQHLIASVHRDAIASMAARRQMLAVTIPALEEAGVRVPPDLEAPKLEAQLQEAQATADTAYTDTLTLLKEQVIDAPASGEGDQAVKNSAAVMQVVVKYGQAQLARAVNNDADAKKHLAEAVGLVKGGGEGSTLQAEDYPVYLRQSLGLIQPPPTTGPATRPAGAAPARATPPAAAPATPPAAPAADPPAETPAETPAAPPAETPEAPPAATPPVTRPAEPPVNTAADPATADTPAGDAGDANK